MPKTVKINFHLKLFENLVKKEAVKLVDIDGLAVYKGDKHSWVVHLPSGTYLYGAPSQRECLAFIERVNFLDWTQDIPTIEKVMQDHVDYWTYYNNLCFWGTAWEEPMPEKLFVKPTISQGSLF